MSSFADAHCHLYDLPGPDLDGRIARWRDAGLAWVLCVSEDRATMEKALRLKECYPEFIRAGLGLHPAEVTVHPNRTREALDFMAAHLAEADMVGEAGLDYKYAGTDQEKEAQRTVLEEQLRMAADAGLGVNLHSRRAQREVMEEALRFRGATGLPALLHWFTHSRKLVRKAAEGGVFISAGPAILHSEETLRVAASIPTERLVLESDAPVPFNGIPADPGQIPLVAVSLAQALEMDLDGFTRRIHANACGLLQPR